MQSRLKNTFLIRDIVRIMDVHFERQHSIMASLDRLQEFLHAHREGFENFAGSVIGNDISLLEGLSEMTAALGDLNAGLSEIKARITEDETRFPAQIEPRMRPILVNIDEADGHDIGAELLQFLYSYLPTRSAFTVGIHTATVTERLLDAGYEVYAFEPRAPLLDESKRKLGTRLNFHAHLCVIGGENGVLAQRDASQGQPRTLASLISQGELPGDASLLNIDTGGCDLQVLRGVGPSTYCVVMAKFRDVQFGTVSLKDIVQDMHNRGYKWYVVIYFGAGEQNVSFYCNRSTTVSASWGNVVFFLQHSLFVRAREWCESVMQPTFFR